MEEKGKIFTPYLEVYHLSIKYYTILNMKI